MTGKPMVGGILEESCSLFCFQGGLLRASAFPSFRGPHLEPVRWKIIIPCSKKRVAIKPLRSESLDVRLISNCWGISCEMEWNCLMCQVFIRGYVIVHIVALKQTEPIHRARSLQTKSEANPVGWNIPILNNNRTKNSWPLVGIEGMKL